MAEVCYITHNKRKIVSTDEKHNDEVEYKLCKQYDNLDEDKIKKELSNGTVTNKERKIEVEAGKLVLKIRRTRDGKEEYIKISVFDSIEDCKKQNTRETFFTNILEIEAVITKIVRMGTGLVKNNIKEIKNIIEDAYPDLCVTVDNEKDSKECQMKNIIKMYYDILKERLQDCEKGKTVNISTAEFKEMFENSEYCDRIPMKDVRAYLKKKELTKCNFGATDYAIKSEGKTRKVIAFNKEKLTTYADEEQKSY